MDKKKRSGNITEEQRCLLIEFMKPHPELVSGKFSKTFTYDHAAKLWQNVTEILNACNGAEKNWKSWRKCWQDYRSRSKTKQAEIDIERRKTGGGTQCNAVLTPDEEQVLELIPSSLTKGHADVLESCMDMTLGEEDNFRH
ncbi:Regulatory protein zeste [Camponotus japonicus]